MTNPPDDSHHYHALTAISAVDGRYRNQLATLAPLVSEAGLIRNRVRVELAWFRGLANEPTISELPPLTDAQQQAIQAIADDFDTSHAAQVKAYERTTNHDVKAVEYFVKDALAVIPGLEPYTEFVHFACTSEDINNCAYALLLGEARDSVLMPALTPVSATLDALALRYADVPMLSRTHGQAATPSTVGKELRNIERRLSRQLAQLSAVLPLAKLNGAVGNFNAHTVAYPQTDWPALAERVLGNLGLTSNTHTTQIEPHDWIAEFAHALLRVHTVLLDAARDFWAYISLDYFKQRLVAGETGSSTMPHKVNPIDFENAEGNLGISNALLDHLAQKLPVSRLQRDLSDSTALRNLGTAIGHSMIASNAFQRGLNKLELNEEQLRADLNDNWEVLGEAVQTVMRRHGLEQPYERIKAVTRGQRLDAQGYQRMLNELALPADADAALRSLTPASYLGHAAMLARDGHSTVTAIDPKRDSDG